MLSRFRELASLTHSHRIARRYFVTNGFDGVLAMLGLLMGFRGNPNTPPEVIVGACLGVSVALFMSGLTSAYISESAEKRRELRDLERSMVTDLDGSVYSRAARWMPLLIAAVNGLSPLLLSLLVIFPLFLSDYIELGISPLDAALGVSLILVFLIGVYLGRISGRFWLWTGLRAVLIAIMTSIIIWMTQRVLAGQ